MGAFGNNSQGMDLKPRAATLSGNRLTRTVEMEFLCSDAAVKQAAPQNIRDHGLWIGMLLRPGAAHRVVSFRFSVGRRALVRVPPLPNTPVTLPPLTSGSAITSLTSAFGNGAPHGKWVAFELAAHAITDPVQTDEVLFFELVLDGFNPVHALDVHVAPVVATLPMLGFTTTYFMGLSAFTSTAAQIDDFATTIVTMKNPWAAGGFGPVRPRPWP